MSTKRAFEPSPGERSYRVALTGNIASGKSVVADEWARRGASIIDADELARAAVRPGMPGLDQIRREFGDEVMQADGTLDRAALRRIVFAEPARRARLEQILHPEIARLRDEREERLAARGGGIVVHMIPLLFETGMQGEFDAVVLVDAPERVRFDRLTRLRGLDEDEARAMIAAQMPAARKRKTLDTLPGRTRVIENDGTLAELKEQAREAWKGIEQAAERA